MSQTTVDSPSELLANIAQDQILILDGAMGTMIQALRLDERSMRGDRFADHHKDLKNCVDLLSLVHPDKQVAIHHEYLMAGADIICTNTFNASPIGLIEFDFPEEVVAISTRPQSVTPNKRSTAISTAIPVNIDLWPDP